MPPIHPSKLGDMPRPNNGHLNPVVLLLRDWNNIHALPPNPIGAAVTSALNTDLKPMLVSMGITDAHGFLEYVNALLYWIPTDTADATDVYDTICLFYFIFDQAPLGSLQTPVVPTSYGQDLTFLSSWIVTFAQVLGLWMDNPASLTPASLATFAQPGSKYNPQEWAKPDGYVSFNDFFYRQLKPGCRPIAGPDDVNTIVFPADCTFDLALPVESNDTLITAKGITWPISDLLSEASYASQFTGGVWMHAFLNTFNYHWQHAPVSGKIVDIQFIQGAAYLDVTTDGNGNLRPKRRIKAAPQADVQPQAKDGEGFQFLQNRGLITIDAGPLGYVAVLPIGMAQVSSVIPVVTVGQTVNKGDPLAHFKFGGSDIVCVFSPEAKLSVSDFPAAGQKQWSQYGSLLATAHT